MCDCKSELVLLATKKFISEYVILLESNKGKIPESTQYIINRINNDVIPGYEKSSVEQLEELILRNV